MKTVGLKSGRFSTIHRGHISCFRKCLQYCDNLIVFIHNTNDVGLDLEDKIEVLQSIKYIDNVWWYNEETEDEVIRWFIERVAPFAYDLSNTQFIMFHSSELKDAYYIPAKHLVDKVIFIDRESGISSTKIINRVKKR